MSDVALAGANEQSRLNGMGSEREAKLIAERDAAFALLREIDEGLVGWPSLIRFRARIEAMLEKNLLRKKLTQQDRDMINLYMRSPQDESGWAKTSPLILGLVRKANVLLFDIDASGPKVRLTPLGRTLEEWL